MVKLAIMEMIATPRPWSDLRYATTSECVGGARPAQAGRGSEGAVGRQDILELFLRKRPTTHTHTILHSIPQVQSTVIAVARVGARSGPVQASVRDT
jgi:hypothetical protein